MYSICVRAFVLSILAVSLGLQSHTGEEAAATEWDLLDELPATVSPTQLSQLRNAIGSIDAYVTERGEHDGQKIMARAKKMLAKLREPNKWPLLTTLNRNRKQQIIKALEIFTSLRQTETDCGYESYLILAKNYIMLNMGPKGRIKSGSRVMEVVSNYLSVFGTICLPGYVGQFQLEWPKISPELLANLDKIFDDEFISNKLLLTVANDAATHSNEQLILSKSIFKFNLYDDSLVRRLNKKLTSSSLNGGQKRTGPDRLIIEKKLFVKYVLEPCTEFTRQLKNIFTPARFAAMSKHKLEFYLADSGYGQFVKRWKQYRICLAYLEADQSRFVSKD